MTDDAVIAPPPSYRTAAALSLATFVLYLLTLSPTISLWDAGEYVAAAARMGIPHPPGNPGFVLLGRVVAMLPIARTVALRLNVLVALASAISCGLWFLVAEHLSRGWLGQTRARIAAAVAAVLGATAFTVWNHSVVNEKVYTISMLLLVLDLWSALRWQAEPDGRRADRRLALVCYRLGIGYTVHIAGLLAGPAVLAAVLRTRPSTLRRGRLMATCAALFLLGLSPFITLPVRAAFRLEINEGHPTACEGGRPQWGCTVSRTTLNRFLYEHNRTQYAKPSVLERQQSMPNQLKMWWLYFKWQWMRDIRGHWPEGQSALAVLMLSLACFGGYAHWRNARESFVPFATIIATLTIGLIYYLNFKLGYSQAVAMGLNDPGLTEARDRDYFFLWSYSALSVWIGLGLAQVWRTIAEFAADGERVDDDAPPVLPRTRHWSLAGLVLLVAAVPLVVNGGSASRRGQTFAEDFAVDMLNSVEPNGVIFTGGDNDSFPLWFAQQVLGVRRDVSVVLVPYLSTDWYVRELLTRTPEPYDEAKGLAVYRGLPHALPTRPLLALTAMEADSIPDMTQTFEPQRVQLPGFVVTLDAGQIPRDVLVMLRIIRDAGPERPIYFSHGAKSPTIVALFRDHLVLHGLARKLVPDAATMPGVIMTEQEGRIDLARSRALWDTFRARTSMERQGAWVDEASANVPYSYFSVGIAISDSYAALQNKKESSVVAQSVLAMAKTMEFDRYMRRDRHTVLAPTGLGYAPVER